MGLHFWPFTVRTTDLFSRSEQYILLEKKGCVTNVKGRSCEYRRGARVTISVRVRMNRSPIDGKRCWVRGTNGASVRRVWGWAAAAPPAAAPAASSISYRPPRRPQRPSTANTQRHSLLFYLDLYYCLSLSFSRLLDCGSRLRKQFDPWYIYIKKIEWKCVGLSNSSLLFTLGGTQ